MPPERGMLTLMGSGELTATMVEVHKQLLAELGPSARAVFLDTPAGFQLNADQISAGARRYFREKVRHTLEIVSLKAPRTRPGPDTEAALNRLRRADYVLIGPGSPTYAVQQWRQTAVADIFHRRIENGGCLVAASAAALTLGAFTLPVYEIYKVGRDLYWETGMDLLSRLGIPLVVIPHWNNAEGGTHDTRFCFMGAERFLKLQRLLPEDAVVLGIDEHTACIVDFQERTVSVKGIGSVSLLHADGELVFQKGDRFGLEVLTERRRGHWKPPRNLTSAGRHESETSRASLWDRVRALEADFQEGLSEHTPADAVAALLELDRLIWDAHQGLENPEAVSQIREVLRELMVRLGAHMDRLPPNRFECLQPLVEQLLDFRKHLKAKRQWQTADAIRDQLNRAGIIVEDTPEGYRWRLEGETIPRSGEMSSGSH